MRVFMDLRQRLSEEMKSSMKEKDALKTSAIRMLRSAILMKDKEGKGELDEAGIHALIGSLVKQRKESAEAFRNGDREESAAKEEAEIEILKAFLPDQLSPGELTVLVDQAIAETGATEIKQMGQVIGKLKPQVAGKADMGQLSGLVKSRLMCESKPREYCLSASSEEVVTC